MAGLTAQMRVWEARIKVGSTTWFPLFERCLKMNRIDWPNNMKACIIEDLEIASAEFQSYFNNDTLQVLWYRDSFNTKFDPNANKQKSWQSSKFRMP